MRKFLGVVFSIVFFASVICSFVFGFKWRNSSDNVDISNQENIELIEENKELKDSNEELIITITDLRKNVSALEKEKTGLVGQVNELKENNRKLQNDLDSEIKDNEQLRAQIEENNTLIAQLEQNISNLQAQITELNRQITLLETEINNLKSEIDSFNTLTPVSLDFTQEQLQNSTVKMYLAGLENGAGIANFVSVKGSFMRDNQCVIISNIVDGDGNKGLGYTCFTYDVKKTLTADYVVELMMDEIFASRVVSNGVCMSIEGLAYSNNYTSLLEYYNSHKTAEYKFAKSINGIDDLFISVKVINSSSTTTYKYSVIAYGEEIPTLYLDGLDKSSENIENFVINTLDKYRYVEIPANVTLENSSWELVSYLSEKGIAQQYYNVGDEKNITLTTGEEITVQILDFDHDKLSNGASNAGITFGLKNSLNGTKKMNDTATSVGGWKDSLMRTETISTIYETFPDEVKSVIKIVDKNTSAGNKDATIITTQDKLFLFSMVEIFGTVNKYPSEPQLAYEGEGTQYLYFKNAEIPQPLDTSLEMFALEGELGTFYCTSSDPDLWWGFVDPFGQKQPNPIYNYYNYNAFKAEGESGSVARAYWLRSPTCDKSSEFLCSTGSVASYAANYSSSSGSKCVCFGFCV